MLLSFITRDNLRDLQEYLSTEVFAKNEIVSLLASLIKAPDPVHEQFEFFCFDL